MKTSAIHFSILVPDGEHPYLRVISNCLSQTGRIKIYIMSNKKNIAMRYSTFVHHFSYYPKTLDIPKWISYINIETSKHSIDLILPIFEDGMLNLIKRKELLTNPNILSNFSSLKFFLTAKNKKLFADHVTKYNIPSPNTSDIKKGMSSAITAIDFPMLAKPTEQSGGGEGIVKLTTQSEFDNFLSQTDNVSTYMFQEYIEGYDMGCNVLCQNGDILAYTIQKGFLWGKKSYAPQIGLKFVYDEELLILVKKLMKSLNWSGVANIDVRYDIKNGSYKIIEVNPRYWATIEASLLAGINFPYLYCLMTLGENFETPKYEHMSYLGLRGLLTSVKKDVKILLKPSYIWNNTPIKFIIQDPISILYHYAWSLKRILFKRINIG